MTRDAPRRAAPALMFAMLAAGAMALPVRAAEATYPFEGTWVRANRVCTAAAPGARTYTAHEVTSPKGHCAVRKVASGGGQFEIFEDCRRAEHPGNYTETIRLLGPDLMQVRRQAARLKIARPLRYARCTVAAPAPAAFSRPVPASGPPHRSPANVEAPPHPVEDRAPKGVPPKP